MLCAIGIVIGISTIFIYDKKWERFDEMFDRSLRASGWIILLLSFLLGTASLLNFEKAWVLFHVLFFPQGNWAFPASSTLIMLYPAEFFAGFIMKWLFLITLFAIVAIGLSIFMQRMRFADHAFSRRRK